MKANRQTARQTASPRGAIKDRLENTLCTALPMTLILFMSTCALLFGFVFVRDFIDDTGYHIPMAVEIARHHNPYYVDQQSAYTAFWYPAGAETLVAILVGVTGSIDSTNLSGALFFILFLATAYHFAGLWAAERVVRLLCTALVSLVPVLLAQTRAFYVDITINFFVFLSLYCYARALVRKDPRFALLGLASALLTPGIKYHGLVFCAVLVPAGLYVLFRTRALALSRRIWLGLAAGMLLAGAFSSGWYIRNACLKGNPVYPVALPAPLAAPLAQALRGVVGTNYQSLDFPIDPQVNLPYPLIPQSLSYYRFPPDLNENAFGLGFPVALVMLAVGLTGIKRMTPGRREMLVFLGVITLTIILALPYHLSVPRYVLFVPVLASLWPAVIFETAPRPQQIRRLICCLALLLGGLHIGPNLIANPAGETLLQTALSAVRDNSRTDIVRFEALEKGSLRVGYMSGRFAFIAALYDQRMTNQIFQLTYRDSRLDLGVNYATPEAFIAAVQALHLDYIVIFDPATPGADILQASFPDRIILEDTFK